MCWASRTEARRLYESEKRYARFSLRNHIKLLHSAVLRITLYSLAFANLLP